MDAPFPALPRPAGRRVDPRRDWRSAVRTPRRSRCPRAAAPSAAWARSSPPTRSPAPARCGADSDQSPGASGFGPQLSLSYDSGSGNGPFGFGWNLSLPAITRKTDKGLPQYRDAEESDVFILSGAEDLVPVLRRTGARRERRRRARRAITIHRYRPRIEGLFARSSAGPTRRPARSTGARSRATTSRRSTARQRLPHRRSRPTGSARIFSWLICESYDDKGNAIVYEYGRRTTRSRPRARPTSATAIAHGQPLPEAHPVRQSRLAPDPAGPDRRRPGCSRWSSTTASTTRPPKPDARPWRARDPFSSYRAGFEVRTYRLCQRVLMFHHFAGEPRPALPGSVADFFSRLTRAGAASGVIHPYATAIRHHQRAAGTPKSLPTLEFDYSRPVSTTTRCGDAGASRACPGRDGGYQWVDLDGEGIPAS